LAIVHAVAVAKIIKRPSPPSTDEYVIGRLMSRVDANGVEIEQGMAIEWSEDDDDYIFFEAFPSGQIEKVHFTDLRFRHSNN